MTATAYTFHKGIPIPDVPNENVLAIPYGIITCPVCGRTTRYELTADQPPTLQHFLECPAHHLA